MKVAAVINFCSNESKFISKQIKELTSSVDEIIIPVCDHFFDGKKEDFGKLQTIFATFDQVQFILYPFMPELFPEKERAHLLHNVSRLIGYQYAKNDWLLFLDADEVVDGERFASWTQENRDQKNSFLKFSCYWYFREPCYRAMTFETSPLMAKKSALNKRLIMDKDERTGTFNRGRGRKFEGVLGLDGAPMFHHYSWVRSKEEILRKTESWGHKGDQNWKELIEKEWTGEFSGKDFIHGYSYQKVEPFISLEEKFSALKSSTNLIKISPSQMISMIKGPFLSKLDLLFGKNLAKKALLRDHLSE